MLLSLLSLVFLASVVVWCLRPPPRVVLDQRFEDNAPTVIEATYVPRQNLVTVQEAKTVVRHIIAYRPTRR